MKNWGINWIDSGMRAVSYLGLIIMCGAVVIQLDATQRNVSAGTWQEPGDKPVND